MLIPVMVVFVLLITVYFLYREYKYDNYRNKKEEEVYQYFGGECNLCSRRAQSKRRCPRLELPKARSQKNL